MAAAATVEAAEVAVMAQPAERAVTARVAAMVAVAPAAAPGVPGRRRLLMTGLALGAAAPLLAACGSKPAPARALDLGPAPVWPAGASLPRRVDIQVVSTSELTQGRDVAYRLDDTDPFTRRVYRDSRWAAPLSTLMSDRLKQLNARAVLAPGADPAAPVVVRLDLEDCVQRFSSPTQSEVSMRLGVTTGAQRRVFEASAPAGGNAEGGARAIAQVLDRLGVEMLVWAAGNGVPAQKR
ncbi:hypothetical protein CDN98_22950 [Roseateles terrae]|nr:hypothetical protein CDN98_22950 [Roseateles terrae]